MKVVILAGGLGTRISEESHLKPKPMIEIGDRPILWHIMKFYSSYGYNEFIICLGYKGNLIKRFFADYYLYTSNVTFDFSNCNNMKIHNNTTEPWKVTLVDTGLSTMTGGRIKRIKDYLDNEPFMLTYGDGLADVNLKQLAREHMESGKILTMTAIQPGSRFGVLDIHDLDNSVLDFVEKPKGEGSWINGGFMVASPGIFDYLVDDTTILEQEPFQCLAKEGQINAFKHFGFWQCMDNQRDRNTLEIYWKNDQAKWKRWE